MKRILIRIFGVLVLVGFAIAPSHSGETPLATVEIFNKGIGAKSDILLKAMRSSLALDSIALRSVGQRHWQKWSEAQHQAYIRVFTIYVLAIYQKRFRDYEGGGLDIYKVDVDGNKALVYTRIKIPVDQKTLSED